tara:strand:- start:193 stop:477 length:285 start_codon:yes stop_codon:yes gene_type:complete
MPKKHDMDIMEPCYICGEEHIVTRMVQVYNDPEIYVHTLCLCPTGRGRLELELTEEICQALLEESARVNLSVNHIVHRVLLDMLRVQEQNRDTS